jgi:ribosomal protein S16
MKGVTILITLITIALVFGCKHTPPEKQLNNTPTGGTSNPCDSDTVYFVNDILPILSSSCAYAGCHDAASKQDGVQLTDYLKIITTGKVKPKDPADSEIYEVITETDPDKIMPPPPASPLSKEQIEKIAKWIEQGAKNNQCSDCDTSNVTYTNTVSTILSNNCIGCHSSSNASGSIILDSYTTVKAQVDNGKLNGVINHLPNYKPMPPSGVKLTECDLRSIDIWIQNGALND